METVTNAASTVASTASNLLWGTKPNEQSGTEPRSGEVGSSNEPYDAGNIDGVPGNPGQNLTGTTTTGVNNSTTGGLGSNTENSASGGFGSTTGDTYSRNHSSNTDNASSGHLGSNTNNTTSGNFGSTSDNTSAGNLGSTSDNTSAGNLGSTSDNTSAGNFGSTSDNTSSSNYGSATDNRSSSNIGNPASQSTTGAVNGPGASVHQRQAGSENTGGFSTSEPSVGADPSSGQTPHQKQQGADRPQDAPEGGVGHKAKSSEEEEKERGERALANRSPDDHSGEPLRIHDDAHEAEMRSPDRTKSVGQEGGGEHGKEQGTGEQHVKTSGMAADGGDFDATKPGAGREADRLLEQKGIKKSDSNKGPPIDTQGDASNTSGTKVSKMDKLKEKLHIGSKKE